MGFFSDIVGFVTDPIVSLATGLLGKRAQVIGMSNKLL